MPASIEVISLDGRVVRSLSVAGASLAWDRRDASGRTVPAGVYVVRIRAATGPAHAKVTL